MNKFYQQPILLQWLGAIILFICGFLPALFIIKLAYSQSLFYLLFLLYLPVAQFSFTPILKLLKVYTYYSPMLLGYMANKTQIDLHSGTSFDYLFVMNKYKPKTEYRIKILAYHLEGLLTIIQQIEEGKIPKTVTVLDMG